MEAARAFGHFKDHAGVAGGAENDQRDGVHGAMIRKEHGNVQGWGALPRGNTGGVTAGKSGDRNALLFSPHIWV